MVLEIRKGTTQRVARYKKMRETKNITIKERHCWIITNNYKVVGYASNIGDAIAIAKATDATKDIVIKGDFFKDTLKAGCTY